MERTAGRKLLRHSLILLLVVSFLRIQAQEVELLSPKQLKRDIRVLFRNLERIHPDCFHYAGEANFRAEMERLKNADLPPMTREAFYSLITPAFTLTGDGHSQIIMPLEYTAWDSIRVFPLSLNLESGQAWIKGVSDTIYNRYINRELVSVDGIPVCNIIDSLIHYYSAETKECRIEMVERLGFSELLYYVFGCRDSFQVVLKGESGRKDTLIHLAGASPGWDLGMLTGETRRNSFQITDSGVAHLEIMIFPEPFAFRPFLDSCFSLIQQSACQSLIIDLRESSGGNSDGALLLMTYITDSAFLPVGKFRTKVTWKTRKYIHRTYGLTSYILPLWAMSMGGKSFISGRGWPVHPTRNAFRFRGKVQVLTSAFTYSSASGFAVMCHDNHVGTICGTETGGRCSGYGPAVSFRLPKSKLTVYVSCTYSLRPAGYDDGSGVGGEGKNLR